MFNRVCFRIDSQKVGSFMRMQLRMLEIRNEIELLENVAIRKTYEDVYFKGKSDPSTLADKSNVYIVTMVDAISKQMQYFDTVKSLIGGDAIVKCAPSLMVTYHMHCPFSLH